MEGGAGMNLRVIYQVIETGVVLEKEFDSQSLCRQVVNKLRHSKRCRLIFSPLFN